MKINDNTYGQAFMFNGEHFNGNYSRAIAEAFYECIKNQKISGCLEYFSNNVPIWSSDYAVALVFEKDRDYKDFWKNLESAFLKAFKSQNDIKYYGMEYARRKSMSSGLNYNGHFLFEDGIVKQVNEYEEIMCLNFVFAIRDNEKDNDSILNLIKPFLDF